ncbi:(2E,6E)-farnesyl diphosphate synthase [unidentified bacterial endosymbiont]|uniref:(2E,6E)-farnesyl diphosphate synthase n=1 Tax=unidentified bacterial endosymbiont TaxID=2355 RepID=UPI00209F4F1C|nr:(2E,6E)-farnesyl diphosphate synthase [unidentified bacterial endosymbiont]
MSSIEQQLQPRRQRLDNYLQGCLTALPFADSHLAAVMRYGLLLGGKRIRPLLLYLVGDLFALPVALLDAPAAAVECLHAYSLLHDDLPAMDNSPLRRGQPTAHVQFGEAQAILAGDALQTLAFLLLTQATPALLTPATQLRMLQELAQTSSGLCYGQSLDLQADNQPLDTTALAQIHHYKTALLIRCAIRLAALAAKRPGEESLPLLDRYAQALGLAFQLQDDLLDVTGTTAQLGKPPGSDQRCGKSSYLQLGIDATQERLRQLHHEAFAALSLLPYDTTALEAFTHYLINRND